MAWHLGDDLQNTLLQHLNQDALELLDSNIRLSDHLEHSTMWLVETIRSLQRLI